MMCECPNKPQKPMVIMAGIKGIKLQLSKLKDKDRPRYVSDGISFDAETIKEKTAIYEKRLEEETKKYNDALKNPPNFDIEEIINTELKRNKCYKENRDKEFMEKVKKVLNGEESDSESENDD